MALNGREFGRPRRLGLDVASVASGILAAQGVLAGLIGRELGNDVSHVETSVVQAGLLAVNHYLAAATCDPETADTGTAPASSGTGPPFPTADGQWVELEALDPDCWKAFWAGLGVDGQVAGRGWGPFASRHETATCRLPPALREATAQSTHDELAATATATGISLCRVRGYADLTPPEAPPWHITPGPDRPGGEDRRSRSAGGPLAGVQVVEVTRRIQAPLAGQLLRMLGARVTRVEPPGGDILRMVEPSAGGVGAIFQSLNRGKRPVELDLRRPAGRDALLDLVADADVLLHNWRPGRDVELSLDYPACAAVNPALVYAYAGGWGAAAASCPPIATDFLVQAHAALGEGLNPVDEPPFPSRVVLADFMGGLVASEAILAGLWWRLRRRRGCRVETSLFDAALALQDHVLEGRSSGDEPGRRGGRPVWGPLDRPLETAEGWLAVTAEDPDTLSRLRRVLGATPAAGLEGIVAQLRTRSAPQWEDALADAGVPGAAVCTDLATLPNDPRVGPFLEAAGGPCRVPASPWRFGP